MDYYPLYMMCALIFLSLLIYCLLGTVAELAVLAKHYFVSRN